MNANEMAGIPAKYLPAVKRILRAQEQGKIEATEDGTKATPKQILALVQYHEAHEKALERYRKVCGNVFMKKGAAILAKPEHPFVDRVLSQTLENVLSIHEFLNWVETCSKPVVPNDRAEFGRYIIMEAAQEALLVYQEAAEASHA